MADLNENPIAELNSFFKERCKSGIVIFPKDIAVEILIEKFNTCSKVAIDMYSHGKANQLPIMMSHKDYFDSIALDAGFKKDLDIDAGLEDKKYMDLVSYFRSELPTYEDINADSFKQTAKENFNVAMPFQVEIIKSFYIRNKWAIYLNQERSLISGAFSIGLQLYFAKSVYLLIPLLELIPLNDLLIIDSIVIKLIEKSTKYYGLFYSQGGHRDRTLISKQSIIDKKVKNKQKVLEAFYKIPDRSSKTLHKVSTIIHGRLQQIYQSPPAISSIKRYLIEDGLADQLFKRNV